MATVFMTVKLARVATTFPAVWRAFDAKRLPCTVKFAFKFVAVLTPRLRLEKYVTFRTPGTLAETDAMTFPGVWMAFAAKTLPATWTLAPIPVVRPTPSIVFVKAVTFRTAVFAVPLARTFPAVWKAFEAHTFPEES
jgi:hypothetical protein